jgi:phospholipid N-methyltransferase
MYLASELSYLSPPQGVGAFADAILSARNKRLWLMQLGISYSDMLRKLIQDNEILGMSQFNQMVIRKRVDLTSDMVVLNDVVERGK